MSKTLHRTLQAKMAALEGPEWDSSDEEGAAPVVPKKNAVEKEAKKKSDVASKKEKKTTSSKTSQKTKTRLSPPEDDKDKQQQQQQQEKQEEENLALYIGHLPKEFEERDLIAFLSQFGEVLNCRISRKIATGNSRGYAFVRFGNTEVTQIVCDTLHGYLLGQQRLVCQVRPAHRGMFYNTDTVIQRRIQRKQLEKKQRDRKLANLEQLKEITARLVSREVKKRKQLQAMGIEYDFPGYKTNQEAFQQQIESKDIVMDDLKQDKASRKRSDSAGSDKNPKKKKTVSQDIDKIASKRSRKDPVDNEASPKMGKMKESKNRSETSETKQSKKKRKDSIDSQVSAKKKKKDSDSNVMLSVDKEAGTVVPSDQVTQSAKKAKKHRKDKKRRASAP